MLLIYSVLWRFSKILITSNFGMFQFHMKKNKCFYLLNFLAAQKNFKILRNATKTICKPSNSKIFTTATYNLQLCRN